MTTTYHYVVTYDEKNRWQINYIEESKKYPNGTIWDEDNKRWEYGYQGDGVFYPNEENLTSDLTEALEKLNNNIMWSNLTSKGE